MCSAGGSEHFCRNACALQDRFRRDAKRRRKSEGVACIRGKPAYPCPDELVERRGNPEWRQRGDVGVENACQLERKERIAAGVLVDAQQRLARERSAKTVVQDPVEGAHTQGARRERLDAFTRKRTRKL